MTLSTDIIVRKVNEVYMHIDCDASTLYEIQDNFSFYAPGYKFNPKFKNKIWDGKIRLFNLSSRTLYIGLYPNLVEFANERGYTISSDILIDSSGVTYDNDIISESKYEPRDYQVDAIKHALDNKRCVLLSPTGSGKSFIIYNIIRHIDRKTLIIVPTISLVHQMRSDFIDYFSPSEDLIYAITAGVPKTTNLPIVISTWQSIYQQPKEWFDQFDVVIGDECHQYKATSLISIMEKCANVSWRIGTTGTVSNKDSKVNVLTLEGLFGPVYKVATTKELMESKHLSQFRIKALVLKHTKEDSVAVRKLDYHGELDFFVSHQKRNRFIAKLALAQTKNTLILFQFVEKHGKVLHNLLNEMNDGSKKIHYVSGEISGEDREHVRSTCENSDNNIIVASYGVFATGVNIRNLHNIIFAMGFKSRIKNLQSIGRGLRLNDDKDYATLYDIVDDCSVKSKQNFSVKHFIDRIQIYNEEKFDFKIHNVNL